MACKNDPAEFCLSVRQSLLDGADHLASLEGLVADSRRLNAYGAIEEMLNVPVTPVLTGEAKIAGDTVCGQTLTAETALSSTPAIPDLGELHYQWLRDGLAIEGAVFQTYILVQADVDSKISVQVSAENCVGTVTSPSVGPIRASFDRINERPESSFKLYPNPSCGSITIEGKGQLVVTNTLGQTILTREIDGPTTIEIPQGLYFAKLGDVVKKVVVE